MCRTSKYIASKLSSDLLPKTHIYIQHLASHLLGENSKMIPFTYVYIHNVTHHMNDLVTRSVFFRVSCFMACSLCCRRACVYYLDWATMVWPMESISGTPVPIWRCGCSKPRRCLKEPLLLSTSTLTPGLPGQCRAWNLRRSLARIWSVAVKVKYLLVR